MTPDTEAWDGRCRSRWRIRTHRLLIGRRTTLRCERTLGHGGLHEYGRHQSPSGLPLVWTDDMADRSAVR